MTAGAVNPDPSEAAAAAVVSRLRAAGYTACFAGGCVRDLLLGILPADYDVATSAEPARVRQLFSSTQAVGAAFGVILVRQGPHVIEVATFRTDGTYRDGRRPESVSFTTPDADARRRDFTINGMFFDPIERRVIDYVGGQADLRDRILRAIGDADERFAEDQLRLLRAVRFAARFGLTIDPATASAIHRHAGSLPRISPERIADELRRMLTPHTRAAAAQQLRMLGLLPVLLRQFPQAVGDCGLFDALSAVEFNSVSFGLALAVLVLDAQPRAEAALANWLTPDGARQAARTMRQTLKISNDEFDTMAGAMDLAHLLQSEPPRVATVKRFLARATSPDAIRLLRTLRSGGFFAARIESLLRQFESLAGENIAPAPLVTGDDLTAAGARPGPAFKRALDAAYDAQLEGKIQSPDAALALALRLLVS